MSAVATTSSPTALSTKAGATPTRAISSPPIAGPTMRAALKEAEFSATALARSALPTISTMNDWRAGESNVWARPASTATAPTCQ